MAAAPAPPSGEDVTGIAGFLAWVKDWGWGALGAIGLPAAWHVSGRLTKIEERLEQHAAKFMDQATTNRDIRDRVDTLADKDDVRALREEIRDVGRRVDQAFSGHSRSPKTG